MSENIVKTVSTGRRTFSSDERPRLSLRTWDLTHVACREWSSVVGARNENETVKTPAETRSVDEVEQT